MITIPTTELIGGLTDVLPVITDPKSSLAGVRIAWDGEALHFTAYDVISGGTVQWVPGEGAEGNMDDGPDGEFVNDDVWGGEDSPWAVWIYLPQAKEILKLFKLPAKLWRFPVTLKCSPTGDRLIIEREDGPRVGRLLMVQTDNDMLSKIPDVREIAERVDLNLIRQEGIRFNGSRLGAFGTVRPHGSLAMAFGSTNEPVGVKVGTRYAGFIYPAGAEGVRPYSASREAAPSNV